MEILKRDSEYIYITYIRALILLSDQINFPLTHNFIGVCLIKYMKFKPISLLIMEQPIKYMRIVTCSFTNIGSVIQLPMERLLHIILKKSMLQNRHYSIIISYSLWKSSVSCSTNTNSWWQ